MRCFTLGEVQLDIDCTQVVVVGATKTRNIGMACHIIKTYWWYFIPQHQGHRVRVVLSDKDSTPLIDFVRIYGYR